MGAPNTGYLNGLRALAALWVLLAHCAIWSGHGPILPDPKLAVSVFMVLSGYLMTATAADFERLGEWRRFYVRRFFRLAPLYYLVLTAVAVSPWVRTGLEAWGRFPAESAYSPAHAAFTPGNLALHYSFAFGLLNGPNTSTLLPDWSLSLEMQFYALFPAIWLAMARWGALRVTGVLTLVSLALWWPLRSAWADPSPLLLQLPYFLAGMLAFKARGERPAMAAAALALACYELPIHGPPVLIVAGAVMLMIVLDRWRCAPVRRILDNPAMKVGADVSYGVYLTHIVFIAAGGLLGLGFAQLICFVLVGSIGASWLLHQLVERPGIRAGRRILA